MPEYMVAALKPLLEQAGADLEIAKRPNELQAVATRMRNLNLLLASFVLDMSRGMEQFRKIYGLPSGNPVDESSEEKLLKRVLSGAEGDAALNDLRDTLQDLKLHHAALLEGYQQATHIGSAEILRQLDPLSMERKHRDSSIKVGFMKLPSSFKPVMMQVIWEEFIDRFRKLRKLEPNDYEKFFRDGFREGYQKFRESRSGPRPAETGTSGE
ncbi:MAG: hypothetical protein HKN21_08280 [Candidatus Eisenbacteria bacterium]|uniref:Type VI secretion system FHA domain-containing protein n=1 Tax=Eiseniibacteriota bacterium TaxID=2212470 RepID=A0A7Y2H2J0_UNCEI|nr:hypothetical protein [Candidatus Eisenbacteria bacterium]